MYTLLVILAVLFALSIIAFFIRTVTQEISLKQIIALGIRNMRENKLFLLLYFVLIILISLHSFLVIKNPLNKEYNNGLIGMLLSLYILIVSISFNKRKYLWVTLAIIGILIVTGVYLLSPAKLLLQ